MTPLAALLRDLARAGIELSARDDRIGFRPWSAMSADLRERAGRYKPELLVWLRARGAHRGGGPPRGPAHSDGIDLLAPEVRPPAWSTWNADARLAYTERLGAAQDLPEGGDPGGPAAVATAEARRVAA